MSPTDASGTLGAGPIFIGKLPTNTAPLGSQSRFRGDPGVQTSAGPGQMPSPLLTFEGINVGEGNPCTGCLPPDPNGDVSPNHYVQVVNTAIEIWDKSGAILSPTRGIHTLFEGQPVCGARSYGDPTVLYDQFADRWLVSQFAVPNYPDPPSYECVAVSTTGDPTGSWCAYEFESPIPLNDYPKFDVWPSQNAYFMTANQFVPPSYVGPEGWALERDQMLTCQTARVLDYPMSADLGSILPADPDGSNAPPAGAPAPMVAYDTTPQEQLEIWNATVDWSVPYLTIAHEGNLATAAFTELCPGIHLQACIPQPGTAVLLEALSDRLMYRLAYRNFGGEQAMVVNHTVDAGSGVAGVRWYQLSKTTTGNWSIAQQGTYSPDTTSRWMGSAAMDHDGNIAVGFSTSSATEYPAIEYAGRLVSDPPGELSQGEATLFAGAGSQTDPSGRWGDHTALTVDPSTIARSGTRTSTTRPRVNAPGTRESARSSSRAVPLGLRLHLHLLRYLHLLHLHRYLHLLHLLRRHPGHLAAAYRGSSA